MTSLGYNIANKDNLVSLLLKKVIEKDPKKYPKLAAELGIKSKK